MLGGQADPTAAGHCVQVRCALAHQVGQPLQALGTRGGRRCFGHKRVVIDSRGELVAEPLQAESGTLGHAHHVPLVADGVAERMDASGRVVGHLFHVGEDYARSSQGAGYDAR